jgi:hypothetical protein
MVEMASPIKDYASSVKRMKQHDDLKQKITKAKASIRGIKDPDSD